jgi:cytochrome c
VRQAAVLRVWSLATVLIVTAAAASACAEEGDAARGERVFQRCYACHSIDPNETAKLQGPTLFRVVGRPAGAIVGFDYSDAMKARAAAGLVWETTVLDDYIADPEALVPGTRMSAPPMRDVRERADLIAYLGRSGRHQP